jgi:hypothetical protein
MVERGESEKAEKDWMSAPLFDVVPAPENKESSAPEKASPVSLAQSTPSQP